MKRRGLVVLLLAVLMIVFVCVPAFAAQSGGGGGTTKYPWNIPAHVRIVQKDTADNVRIFTTITAALNSITNASATNRYIIKVMPGVYNESVVMKNYVDLEGSYDGNTVIQSNSLVATVVGADQSTIRNLKIVNTAAQSAGNDGIGLFINNVSTNVENAVIEATGSNTGSSGGNYAIRIIGPAANVSLKSIKVRAGGSYDNVGINGSNSAVIDITDSHLTATGSSNPQSWAANVYANGGTPKISIRNSVLEASDAAYVEALLAHGSVSVMSSKISGKNGIIWTRGISNTYQITITGSEITASSSAGAVNGIYTGAGMVGSSLIGGGYPNSGFKIVNCWDEYFNPILNQ